MTDPAFAAGWAACREAAAKVAIEAENDAGPVFASPAATSYVLACREIAAAIRALPTPTPADAPEDWRCFHCGETFTDAKCAAEHFGGDLLALAACQIKADEGGLVALIRKQEDELDRFRSEDTASYREFYSLGAEHSAKLRQAEESGYEKGLADGRAMIAATPTPADAQVDEDGRRRGHSKLVYDKATRTIVTVDPHPPADAEGEVERLRKALRKIAELRYAEDANEPFDEALDIADAALHALPATKWRVE